MEVQVLERVVLGVDRQAVVGRVRRDPVGDRPRGQHAVVLEAQIPVQARGVVLLDDEPRSAAGGAGGVAGGLGRGREVALGAVGVELVGWHRSATTARWSCRDADRHLERQLAAGAPAPRAEFLDEHRPDVACLQETKAAPTRFPTDELGAPATRPSTTPAGGGRAWRCSPGRADAHDPQLGLPGDTSPDEARWCEATVDGIRFASVYVPNGRSLDSPEYPRKLAFLDAMRARGRASSAEPLVVAGDMNIAPADRDVYDPAAFVGGTHVSAPERERLEAILAARDGRRLPGAASRRGPVHVVGLPRRELPQGLGLRIDLALCPRRSRRAWRCGIDRDYRKGNKPSDHAPLLLELA